MVGMGDNKAAIMKIPVIAVVKAMEWAMVEVMEGAVEEDHKERMIAVEEEMVNSSNRGGGGGKDQRNSDRGCNGGGNGGGGSCRSDNRNHSNEETSNVGTTQQTDLGYKQLLAIINHL